MILMLKYRKQITVVVLAGEQHKQLEAQTLYITVLHSYCSW